MSGTLNGGFRIAPGEIVHGTAHRPPRPAPTAHAAPLAWQKFSDWSLTGQYGMRPIVLSVMRGKLALRDTATDRLIPFDPNHPDAHILAAAHELLAAAKQCEEETNRLGSPSIDGWAKLRAAIIKADPKCGLYPLPS